MSYTIHATITFHIPVEHLPPDIPGDPATPTSDAITPISGAEQIAYEFLTKLQQTLPDGVYPMVDNATYTKTETTPI